MDGKENVKIYDAAIVGGGPGGVSAALYAARGGLKTALVHHGRSALHRAERIQNYYGTGEISGKALYDVGIEQARSVGAEIIYGQVTFVSFDGSLFIVTSTAGEILSRRLVIATGVGRKHADIPGIAEYEGRGVSYCAVCDAFFYRKKRVAVIGSGEFAEHEYNVLKKVADAVLLTNGDTPCFKADNAVTDKITRVFGEDGRVKGAEFDNGGKLYFDGIFVALGVLGSSEIAKSVGVMTDKNGNITVDGHGMTNVPGMYAVGDCTAGIKQIGKAVADGITVGTELIRTLNKKG